jgi:hypothetical protein
LRPQKKGRFCGVHAQPQRLGIASEKRNFKLALPVWIFYGGGMVKYPCQSLPERMQAECQWRTGSWGFLIAFRLSSLTGQGSKRAQILKRVQSIKTREQARKYLAEVQRKLSKYRTVRDQENNS